MELLSRFKSDERDLASTEEEDGKRHSRWPYSWPEDLQDIHLPHAAPAIISPICLIDAFFALRRTLPQLGGICPWLSAFSFGLLAVFS
jgi:hypothetical protein